MEFQYLGHKWLRITENALNQDTNFVLQLSCGNQSNAKKFTSQFRARIVGQSLVFPPSTTISGVNESITLGGYFGEVLNIFNSAFNISFTIIRSKEPQFGVFYNGSWHGLVGDLTKGTADIASGLAMTGRRSDYINYSPQLYPLQTDIIYKKFDQRKWNYGFYLKPFCLDMWLYTLAINLMFILVKVFSDRMLSSDRKHFVRRILIFINEILLCWPIVLEGKLIRFKWKSMNFLFGIYIAFSMLLFISYTSTLTSLFATLEMEVPFSSLDDMFENSDFMPVILRGSKPEEIFYKPPYENKSVLRVGSQIEGVELAYSGKFGFLSTLLFIQHLIRRNCSFAVAHYAVSKDIMALGYSKQFVYRDYFNSKILLLKQSGILPVEFKRFFPKLESCSENSFSSIFFGQIIGPFTLILVGILMALIFGIYEVVIGKFNHSKRGQN
uniref:Uncharacterized protein n=1 Tax=Strigamia maritima TaxID=126957 RepID=T1JNU1_STRMM